MIYEALELETIQDFLRFGFSKAEEAQLYYGHGTDNAWDDILSLILRSLHLPYTFDNNLLQTRLTQSEKKHLCEQLEKRIRYRIPVPYLIKEAYFCGLPFYVDERVLIPRSPFAELIENQFSPWIDSDKVHNILDLCTGSACIAIACCEFFPEAQVDAVDIDKAALEVARMNLEKHQLQDQLTLIQSDVFTHIPQKKYDLIISNPPYVNFEDMQELPEEYRHEPKLALEAENNGLAIVDNILKQAPHYLSKEGILVVEVGNSEEALMEAYPNLPFTWLDFERGGRGVFLLQAGDF